jgi:hypothetical protein
MISIEAIFIERIICARCLGMIPASRRGAGKAACHGCCCESCCCSCWVVVVVVIVESFFGGGVLSFLRDMMLVGYWTCWRLLRAWWFGGFGEVLLNDLADFLCFDIDEWRGYMCCDGVEDVQSGACEPRGFGLGQGNGLQSMSISPWRLSIGFYVSYSGLKHSLQLCDRYLLPYAGRIGCRKLPICRSR